VILGRFLLFFAVVLVLGVNANEELYTEDIDGRILIPKEYVNEAKVFLNGGEELAFLRSDGSFTLHSVQPGTHILDFTLGNFILPQVRIDISLKKRGKIRASVSENGKIEVLPYPLLLDPRGKAKYFVPREEYSMLGMLKNPMVIMMLVVGVMAFVLPKLADPEQMKEQMQQLSGDNGQPPSISGLWNQLQEGAEPPAPQRRVESKKKQ